MKQSGGLISLREAALGLSADKRSGGSAHRRAPFPDARALRWAPRRKEVEESHVPMSEGPYELFMGQAVLRGLTAHLANAGREARFGFLLGELFRCPTSGVHYAVVDSGIAVGESFSEDASSAYLLRAWAAVQEECEHHPGVVIGWYHSHYLLGLFESESDTETNRRYFCEPWQCSVIAVQDEERPIGGVFRAASPEGRAEPSPFYELLDPSSNRTPPTSALVWANYEGEVESVRESPSVAADAARPGPFGRLADNAVLVSAELALSDTSPVTPGGLGFVLTDDAEDRFFFRLKRRHPWMTGRLALLAGVMVLALFSWQVWGRGGQEPVLTPLGVPATGPAGRFVGLATALDESIERYLERAADFDLGRIGCDLLAPGYSATDEAFIGMTSEYATLETRSGSREQAIYDRLVDDMNTVNRHFDGSGCPRPR